MQWVGETEKYYGMRMQVFRLRPADLDESPHPRAHRVIWQTDDKR